MVAYVPCPDCGQVFKATGLAIHMAIHRRVRPSVVRFPAEVTSYRVRLRLQRQAKGLK